MLLLPLISLQVVKTFLHPGQATDFMITVLHNLRYARLTCVRIL